MAVESMFSYAYLYRFHGSNAFADQAELPAFNALPVAISPDCEHTRIFDIQRAKPI